jgi:hypothetical protein
MTAGPYRPTSARTGSQGDEGALRLNNLIVRGRTSGRFYWQAYSGEGNLGEDLDMVAASGTFAITENSITVVGTGTAFLDELHLGQRISCIPADNSVNYFMVVRRIIDQETMEVWAAQTATASSLTGWRMPRLFAVNQDRGSCLTGDALKLDRGSYLGVGSGTFRINGQPLTATMDLTREPSIALYDPLTDTYTVFTLGMDTPTAGTVTAAAVGGGSKMQGGNYSFVVTPARKETGGYNNPSDRVDVTIATNDKIQITFPAMDTTNGQNAWKVWVTTFADTLGADLNYLNGPWHYFVMIDDTEVSSAGGTFEIEYYDAEVQNNELVTFNNDPPTDAEFVEHMNSIPVWISCQGQGFAAHPVATSPGPFIVPAKPNNVEAAPLDLAFSTSPPETILGAIQAEGRIYLPTINKLQIAQATPSDIVPIIIRPFWHDGFANPDQLVIVNGYLYGFPAAGPTRSIGDGDEIYAQRDWAEDVAEITLGDRTVTRPGWNPGQVLVGYDPYNDMVLFVHSGDHLNDAGFWTSRILGFGISQNFWIFDALLTSGVRDRIVSGIATIGDRCEMLIGGRTVV